MEKDVQRYFEQGLAASTRKTYQAGIKKFATFCAKYNIVNPLPVSQSVLCLFISHLANLGLAYGTIKSVLRRVRDCMGELALRFETVASFYMCQPNHSYQSTLRPP